MHHVRLPIIFLLMGALMAFRLFHLHRGTRRAGAGRALRLDQLWIVPAIVAAVMVALYVQRPPAPGIWGWLGLAAALGAGIGWWRGGMMRITIDPRTGVLSQQASPAALIFLAALFVLRFAARAVMAGGARHGAIVASDVAVMFAFWMFAAQRLEMFLRGRRLREGRAI